MLYREVPLTIEDLLYPPSATIYDETTANIDIYLMAYPESVKSVFDKPKITYPTMPAAKLLELRKTDS
jgi:hypothetical protein